MFGFEVSAAKSTEEISKNKKLRKCFDMVKIVGKLSVDFKKQCEPICQTDTMLKLGNPDCKSYAIYFEYYGLLGIILLLF
jgi:hypothetical protein